ncbi:hypothetical protein TNCV_2292591 [Trichonephila clavipes]|nr:hypothetical protein TNCV_2292591 [Trichonephila clavipes]
MKERPVSEVTPPQGEAGGRKRPNEDETRVRHEGEEWKSAGRGALQPQNARVTAVSEWYRYPIVGGFVTSSSPVPLKTHRVGQRCTLNLSRAETSARWRGSKSSCRQGRNVERCQFRCRLRHQSEIARRIDNGERRAEIGNN